MNSYKNEGLFAFFYAAAFSALLSIMWVIVRKLSETIHPLEIPFWASIFGLLIFIPTIYKEGIIEVIQTSSLNFMREEEMSIIDTLNNAKEIILYGTHNIRTSKLNEKLSFIYKNLKSRPKLSIIISSRKASNLSDRLMKAMRIKIT